MMKLRLLSPVCLLVLLSCGPTLEEQIGDAEQAAEQLKIDLATFERTCRYGPEKTPDEIREESLAEWDAAAADSVDHVSAEQEWEIRKSLGREMGLAPSEVDGWKDIYEGRGDEAKRTLKRLEDKEKAESPLKDAEQASACSYASEIRTDLNEKRQLVADLKSKIGQ